jgi:hypothetical protein
MKRQKICSIDSFNILKRSSTPLEDSDMIGEDTLPSMLRKDSHFSMRLMECESSDIIRTQPSQLNIENSDRSVLSVNASIKNTSCSDIHS